MSDINYGIVGTGYFGHALAEIIHNIKGANVTVVYDPKNAKKTADQLNCNIATSVESLCQSKKVDAVVIASPNAYHKEPVINAAKYNKHVFCEKPIALSYKDCHEMIEAISEKNLIFMAGHVMNFMDGIRRTKQMINDGEIGNVLFCHAERTGWKDPQKEISWKKQRHLSGGHLYHHIHELDFIQFIMGPAKRVTMVGGNVAHQGEEFGDEDDLLLLTLEFNNNRYATMQYGSAFRWGEHYIKIQGTKGSILIDLQDPKVILKKPHETKQFLLHASKEEDEDRRLINKSQDGGIMYGKPSQHVPLWLYTIMKREMDYFHQVITGVEVSEEFIPLLDGTAARASIATADALTLSMLEDRKVNVSEVTEKPIV